MIKNYTIVQTFGVIKFLITWEVSYAGKWQRCIYLIKNTVKIVILWNSITI